MRYLPLLLCLLFWSCQKDYTITNPTQLLAKDFDGTYVCTITDSVRDFHYDSIGNPLGVVYKSFTHQDTIVIERIENTDSFEIQNLRLDRQRPAARSLAKGDKLVLDEDWSTSLRSKWLSGEIELIGDQLSIEYSWRDFDTWSSGATPYNGFVRGQGSR